MTAPVTVRAAPWTAYACLIAGMAVVGAYVGFSKAIVATVPVFVLAMIRFGIAALALLPWTFPRGGWVVARSQIGTLLALSFFGNFLFSICMLSGVARTSATAAGLIMSMLPAAVAVFSLVVLSERINGRTLVAIALAIVGVSALTFVRAGDHGSVAGPSGSIGNLLMVGAVCCEATYVVLGKRLTTANVGAMQVTAWINLVGFAFMLPLGLWQATSFYFGLVTPALWLLIGLYAIGASVVSVWLWLTGLKHVPASQAGVFTTALPVVSALVGVLFLGESLTLVHLVAFVCAVAGILLITRGR